MNKRLQIVQIKISGDRVGPQLEGGGGVNFNNEYIENNILKPSQIPIDHIKLNYVWKGSLQFVKVMTHRGKVEQQWGGGRGGLPRNIYNKINLFMIKYTVFIIKFLLKHLFTKDITFRERSFRQCRLKNCQNPQEQGGAKVRGPILQKLTFYIKD